jgi:hypothetical protein
MSWPERKEGDEALLILLYHMGRYGADRISRKRQARIIRISTSLRRRSVSSTSSSRQPIPPTLVSSLVRLPCRSSRRQSSPRIPSDWYVVCYFRSHMHDQHIWSADGLIFLLDAIDLANCRQRESRPPDAVGVQYRAEIDWTCASWSRADG